MPRGIDSSSSSSRRYYSSSSSSQSRYSSDPYSSRGSHHSSSSSQSHHSSDPYGSHHSSSSYSSSPYGGSGSGSGGSGGYQYSPSYTPPSPERRDHIRQQAAQNPSFYGKLVAPVNDGLQRGGYGISPSSYHSVQQNLAGVHGGSRSQSEAHFREAAGFGRDATHSYSRGDYRQAGMEALGSAVNTAGGFGTAWSAGSDKLHRQTTPEKRGYGNW